MLPWTCLVAAAATTADTGTRCPDAPEETLLPGGSCDRGPVTERCGGPCPDLDAYLAEEGKSVWSVEACDGGWMIVHTYGIESNITAWFDLDGRVVAFGYVCAFCAGDVCCAGQLTDQHVSSWGLRPELTGCVELPSGTTTTPPTTPSTDTDVPPPEAPADEGAPPGPTKRGCGCAGPGSAPTGALLALVGLARRRRPGSRRRRPPDPRRR